MAQKVNYQADTTFLTRRLAAMMEQLALPVDPHLFADLIDRELNWFSLTLARMRKALEESSFTMNRRQVLYDLRVAATLFVELLQRLLGDRFPIAPSLELKKPRYARMRREARELVAALEQLSREAAPESSERDKIVSEEEFLRLLSDESISDAKSSA